MTDETQEQAMLRAGNEEIGFGNTLGWMGRTEDRYLSDLRGPEGVARMAELLRKEPSVYSAHHLVTRFAGGAEWDVEPASDATADQEAATFVKSLMDDMSHAWSYFIRFAISALAFGFADVEIVWKRREGRQGDASDSKYDDGLVGIRKLGIRRQETVDGWEEDEHGGVQALRQQHPKRWRETVVIPIEKLLHFIGGEDRGGWEGLGWLEPGYKLAHMIENYEIIEGVGWQRTFVGLPVFEIQELPADSTKANNIITALKTLGRNLVVNEQQYVLMHPGVKFTLESVNNSGAGELRAKIAQLRWEMTALVYATILRMGMERVGTEALSVTVNELFTQGVDTALDDIADVLNRHLVPRVLSANAGAFDGMTDYPKFVHTSVRGVPPEFLGNLTGVADWLTRAPEGDSTFLRELLGMPIPQQGDEEWKAPEPAQPPPEPVTREAPGESQPLEIAEEEPTEVEMSAMLGGLWRKVRALQARDKK